MLSNTATPLSVVVAAGRVTAFVAVSRPTSVTDAPGTNAPLGSATVTVSLPRCSVWAAARPGTSPATSATIKRRKRNEPRTDTPCTVDTHRDGTWHPGG